MWCRLTRPTVPFISLQFPLRSLTFAENSFHLFVRLNAVFLSLVHKLSYYDFFRGAYFGVVYFYRFFFVIPN
jgi:hypothetical protein